MATQTLPTPSPAFERPARSGWHAALALNAVRRGWRAARRRAAARAELRELDACTLRDLGVSRAEIESMACEARGGAPPTLRRLARPAAPTPHEGARPARREAGPVPGRTGGGERPRSGAEPPLHDVQAQEEARRSSPLGPWPHGAWSHCAWPGGLLLAAATAGWQPSTPGAGEEVGAAASAPNAVVAPAPAAFAHNEPSALTRREDSAFTGEEVPHRDVTLTRAQAAMRAHGEAAAPVEPRADTF